MHGRHERHEHCAACVDQGWIEVRVATSAMNEPVACLVKVSSKLQHCATVSIICLRAGAHC